MRLNTVLVIVLVCFSSALVFSEECTMGKQKKVPVTSQPRIEISEDHGSAWVNFDVDLRHLPFWSEQSKAEVSMPAYGINVKVDKKLGGTALSFDPDWCRQYDPREVRITVFGYSGVTLHVQTEREEKAWEKLFKDSEKAAAAAYEQKRKKNYKTIQPPQ